MTVKIRAARFGPYTLIPARYLLLRHDVPVLIGSRAFALLTILIERHGSVVGHEDLMRQVWPETSVDLPNLTVQIANLRRCLGDRFEGGSYIATLRGRGYQFAASVDWGTAPVPVGAASDDMPEIEQPSPRKINLPRMRTRLVGRGRSLPALAELIEDERLVTLVGAGGIGKTRVALGAIERLLASPKGKWPDGVWFVDLARLQEERLLQGAVASVLGIDHGAEDSADRLAAVMSDQRMLLVLDNCEHLLAAVAKLVDTLLSACPGLTVLCTSREPLELGNERIFAVLPLRFPRHAAVNSLAGAQRYSAINLFVDRAIETGPFQLTEATIPDVVEICRRLDGIPLAIELAALLVSSLGLKALAGRLAAGEGLVTLPRRGMAARHQTLTAMLSWSYDLLSAAEQAVLRRLSVFENGAAPEAAAAVVADDPGLPGAIVLCREVPALLNSLMRKSLVIAEPGGDTPRFSLLETTRHFAKERLDACRESGTYRRAMIRHLCDLLAVKPVTAVVSTVSENLAAHEAQIPHIRSALKWALSPEGDPPLGIALAGASARIWDKVHRQAEGYRWLDLAMAKIDSTTPILHEAQLCAGLARLCLQSNHARGKTVARHAAALYRRIEDPIGLGKALTILGYCSGYLGEFDEGHQALIEAEGVLAQIESPADMSWCLQTRFMLFLFQHDFVHAEEMLDRARRIEVKEQADWVGVILFNLASALLGAGQIDKSIGHGRQSVELLQHSQNWSARGAALGNLAAALIARGDLAEGGAVGLRALEMLRKSNGPVGFFWLLDHLATLAWSLARPVDAARLIGFTDTAYAKSKQPRRNIEERAHRCVVHELTAQLPPETFSFYCAEGAAWSEAEALSAARDVCLGIRRNGAQEGAAMAADPAPGAAASTDSPFTA